jgi:hypothetical protein
MTTLRPRSGPRQISAALTSSIKEAEQAGYKVQPCHMCAVPVIWASTGQKHSGHRHPIAVEVVELGQGAVALQRDLFDGAGKVSPQAFETATATRFAWHDGRCSGPGSFTAAARDRKVRP